MTAVRTHPLVVAAFLAATLLPVSSELAVAGAVASGLDPLGVFVAASLGNCLGALSDYALGRLLAGPVEARLQGDRWGRRALAWAQRYGRYSLLGSWLPLLGDPILLAAGVLRLSPTWVVGAGLGTRVLRYALVIGLMGGGAALSPWR